MKRIILFSISFFLIIISVITSYLVLIGYETDRFNSVLESKITKNLANTKIEIDKIKVKINVKNISFFVTTEKPDIKYNNNKINIAKIDAYINLKSFIIGKPKINTLNITSNEIEVNEVKNIVKSINIRFLRSLFHSFKIISIIIFSFLPLHVINIDSF